MSEEDTPIVRVVQSRWNVEERDGTLMAPTKAILYLVIMAFMVGALWGALLWAALSGA